MKKLNLFRICFYIIIFVNSNLLANTTSQTINGVTNPNWFIPDDYYQYPGDVTFGRYLPGAGGINPYYRGFNEDWGWTHNLIFNAPGPITVIDATLTIEAWDVDENGNNGGLMPDEIDVIKVGTLNGLGGLELGHLNGDNNKWSTTTFTFDSAAISKLSIADNTGTLNVWMDISSLEQTNGYSWDYWMVTLKSATLSVNYIPEPCTILLGSLGVGLIGLFRRHPIV